jgi:hypothetical protein
MATAGRGAAAMNLHDAMLDPDLFGRTFGGPTFAAWRTVAKFLDGLPLNDAELALYRQMTGRMNAPSVPYREGYLIKPRRAGGTLFAAAVALHAAIQDYRELLGPGEFATVALIASDRRQARQALRYVKGLVTDSPMIAAEVTNETAEGIVFAHRVQLEVHTTSFRSTRGYSFACVVLDELAFFRSDLSANPDVELVRAVRPGLANLKGRLLGLSSPHSRRGHLYTMHRQHYARDSDVLVIQAGGPLLNPTLDPAIVAKARAEDPIAARSEWDAMFREDVTQFLDDALIDRAAFPGCKSRPRQYGFAYTAFVDPSGGRSDAMTLAISHQEKSGKVVLDRLLIDQAPFAPDDVVIKHAEVLGNYGLSSVQGDRYGGEWPVSAYRRHNVTYMPAGADKSAIYRETLPLFTAGRVELLDIPMLDTELRLLERSPRAGGRGEAVDHPPNAHDDAANAACGALWLASKLPCMGRASGENRGEHISGLAYDPFAAEERRAREPQQPLHDGWGRSVNL